MPITHSCCLDELMIYKTTLHGNCNYLLALTSLFEILHQIGHPIFLVIALSGVNFIDFLFCIRLTLLSNFGINGGVMAMALTALDRLLSVIIPLRSIDVSCKLGK